MMIAREIATLLIGYLLGAIPFAYIAGRLFKGIDIRQVGGRNMGALNVTREVGLIPGITVLLLDIAKGAVSVLIAQWLKVPLPWQFLTGIAAVVGHDWPAYLKFRGGRGAATTIGVMLATTPGETGISIGIMVITLVITSNARLAVAIGLFVLPLIIWLWQHSIALVIYSIAIALLLLVRTMIAPGGLTGGPKGRNIVMDRGFKFWQAPREANKNTDKK